MKDEAHKITDEKLEALEKKINRIYSETLVELDEELRKSFEEQKLFDIQDEKKRLLYAKKNRRLLNLIRRLSSELQNSRQIALNLLNDELIDIFQINNSWGIYYMEKISGVRLGLTLYNEQAIRDLLLEETPIFTKMVYDGMKDIEEIRRDLSRELTKSILKGSSIDDLAKAIDRVTEKKNNGAIRIARTESTRIENSGRQKAFKDGEDKGLIMNKQWISTLDKRTRERHREMFMQERKLNSKFSNGLLYPGDSDGKASEVINCRCTHVVELLDIEKTEEELKLDESLKTKSFERWLEENGGSSN